MMPPSVQHLLDQVRPQLARDYAREPASARRDAVALVFAPGLTEEMPPGRPTALLTSRLVARRGLSLACGECGNMSPLATFDMSYTDAERLVVVVFGHEVHGVILMNRRDLGRFEVN